MAGEAGVSCRGMLAERWMNQPSDDDRNRCETPHGHIIRLFRLPERFSRKRRPIRGRMSATCLKPSSERDRQSRVHAKE